MLWPRLGSWSSAVLAVSAASALAMGITTPVRSGPDCTAGCVPYPYTDAARFVPRDYLWVYPAILTTLAVVVLAACLHEWVPPGRRLLSRIGLSFTVLGAGALLVDYGLQLSVVMPALLAGEAEGLALLSPYNPHGVFIGLENTGYALLALALVFLGAALTGSRDRLARLVAWLFVTGGAGTLALLVLLGALYRSRLDYRFEVLSIGITWLVLIIAGSVLPVTFRRSATDHADAAERSNP